MPHCNRPVDAVTGPIAGTTFDQATNVTSHELSEAVTDADVGAGDSFCQTLGLDRSSQRRDR